MVDYIAKQPDPSGYVEWTDVENNTWHQLITRQLNTIANRACDEFIDGVAELNLSQNRVPQLTEVNAKLKKTNWKMVPVVATVLVDEFFTMLKNREFPVATFIRVPAEIDYLQQPDIFHELFGHGPLLLNQSYADFVQWYGEMTLKLNAHKRQLLSRLFWYTIEFGLLKTDQGLRILGGGILSSHEETLFSLGSDVPKRIPFDWQQIMKTTYDYSKIQPHYFVLNDLDQLYELSSSKIWQQIVQSDVKGDQEPFITC